MTERTSKGYRNRILDKEKIRNLVAHIPQINAVFLFGSHALASATPQSDIDLGFVLTPGTTFQKIQLDLLGSFAAEGYDHVDLVNVDESNIPLAFEVVKHRQVLYSRPDYDTSAFFSKITRMYLDFQPFMQVQLNAMRARYLMNENIKK